MRSIEPLNYGIVDTSHPLQNGNVDYIRDAKAVMDVIPYSRVFYHAFPGSIITHRGKKYIVKSLQSPPAVLDLFSSYGRRDDLAAFAEPTNANYSTRALSNFTISVINQQECIQINSMHRQCQKDESEEEAVIGGTGVVTCKRRVW